MATKTKRGKNGKAESNQDANVLGDIREDLRCLQTGQEHVLSELKALVDQGDQRSIVALTARVERLEKAMLAAAPITPP